jgi:hypothetical protein
MAILGGTPVANEFSLLLANPQQLELRPGERLAISRSQSQKRPAEAVGIKMDYTTGPTVKARYAELMAEKNRDLFANIMTNA